jgi:O-antigen/teichoic acid export membrane protein
MLSVLSSSRLRLSIGHQSAAIHLLGMGVRMGFMLALASITSTEVVGIYALAGAIESVVIYLAGFELHAFTARRYARSPSPGKLRILAKCHQVMLCVSIPFSVAITLALASWLKLGADPWVVGGLVVVIAAGMVSQETNRFLLLTRRPLHSAVSAFVRNALWQPVVVVILYLRPADVHAIFVAWALCAVAAAGWTLWLLRAVIGVHARLRMNYLKAGLRNARGYYAISSLGIAQSNLERFALQLLLGPAAVGVFAFFQTIANTIPSLVQAGLLNVMLPNILERFARRDPERFSYLRAESRKILWVCAGLGLALCVVTVPMIYSLGRAEYIQGFAMLPVLIVASSLVSSTQPMHLALYASHKDRVLLLLGGFSLAGSLILNLALIPVLGLAGAVVTPLVINVLVASVRRAAFNKSLAGVNN